MMDAFYLKETCESSCIIYLHSWRGLLLSMQQYCYAEHYCSGPLLNDWGMISWSQPDHCESPPSSFQFPLVFTNSIAANIPLWIFLLCFDPYGFHFAKMFLQSTEVVIKSQTTSQCKVDRQKRNRASNRTTAVHIQWAIYPKISRAARNSLGIFSIHHSINFSAKDNRTD